MPTNETITRLGNCDFCGRRADYNSPRINPHLGLQESPLYCDPCAGKADEFLISINQYLCNGLRVEAKQQTISKRGIVAHLESGEIRAAWFDRGQTAIPTQHIPSGDLEAALDTLADYAADGSRYCTHCHKPVSKDEIAGRPLFAGINCADCWKLHQEAVEQQRRTGNVCRICGAPRLLCCC